jgi:hypothetical protein
MRSAKLGLQATVDFASETVFWQFNRSDGAFGRPWSLAIGRISLK